MLRDPWKGCGSYSIDTTIGSQAVKQKMWSVHILTRGWNLNLKEEKRCIQGQKQFVVRAEGSNGDQKAKRRAVLSLFLGGEGL